MLLREDIGWGPFHSFSDKLFYLWPGQVGSITSSDVQRQSMVAGLVYGHTYQTRAIVAGIQETFFQLPVTPRHGISAVVTTVKQYSEGKYVL